MEIIAKKPLCFQTLARSFLSHDRIDVSYFHPKYLKVEKKIESSELSVSMLEISKKIISSAFYSSIALNYSNTGIPFIRVSDIKNGTISMENIVFIDENTLENNKSINTIPSESLVISKGGTIGKVGVTPSQFKKYALSRDVIGIELKNSISPDYVALFLESSYGFLQLERSTQGQVQSHLTIKGIKEIFIPLHGPDKQNDIIKIMQNARKKRKDKLNEINVLRKELENLFLKTLKLSYSTKEKTDVYIGNLEDRLDPHYYHPKFKNNIDSLKNGKFKLKKLSDVVIFSNEQIKPKEEPDRLFKYIQIQNIDSLNNKIDSYTPILGGDAPGRAKMLIKEGDILVPILGGSMGSICIVPKEYNHEVATNGFAVLRTNDINLRYFLFYYLTTEFAKLQIDRNLTGAIMPSISKKNLKNVFLPVPDEPNLELLAEKINSTFISIENLNSEINQIINDAKIKAENCFW